MQPCRLNRIFSLVLSKHRAMNEVCKKLAFTFGVVSKKVLSFFFLLLKVYQYSSVKNTSFSSSSNTTAEKMNKLGDEKCPKLSPKLT